MAIKATPINIDKNGKVTYEWSNTKYSYEKDSFVTEKGVSKGESNTLYNSNNSLDKYGNKK